MAPRIQHILWDWNGTLLDDVAVCVASINVLLERRHLPAITLRAYRERFCFPVRRYYEILGVDLTGDRWDRVAVEYHAEYNRLAAEVPLRRGMRRVLQRLHRQGLAHSVLSASEITILRRMITARGLAPLLSGVAGRKDLFAHSKVATGRALIRRFRTDPDRFLLVGDTLHDYEVARALGCRCLLLAGGHQSVRRLKTCDCPVLRHPQDVEFFLKNSH